MVTLRYSVRKNEDEYWSVIDIFTGEPAWFHGTELRCLKVDEVDELVDWLNALSAQRRGTLKHP
ncbi:hypothetical protein GOC72_18655 [Sinorhizobium medicae]|nr:hypothetical protein [Sinorhizobium medicae]